MDDANEAASEAEGVDKMDEQKFHLLMDVLKILEKHEDKQVTESALEIVESYNASLSQEQKAEVLKEVLHFRMHDLEEERERRFQDEWRRVQMREFLHPDSD